MEEMKYGGYGLNKDSGKAEVYLLSGLGNVEGYSIAITFEPIQGDSSGMGINWVGFENSNIRINCDGKKAMVQPRAVGTPGPPGNHEDALRHFIKYLMDNPTVHVSKV